MKYSVVILHRSAYPRPIRFARGTLLQIGQRYQGTEPWEDWYLCSCEGQERGWVPAQLIERVGVECGTALDYYCAHELDADPGEQVIALHELGGWIWCRRQRNGELGWLPLSKLRAEGVTA